jgi:hypothetical protein
VLSILARLASGGVSKLPPMEEYKFIFSGVGGKRIDWLLCKARLSTPFQVKVEEAEVSVVCAPEKITVNLL